jgi:hypothetical protein
MNGINIGPFPVRPAATWFYAAPVAGLAVLESATLASAAGPGRRRLLTSLQFSMTGGGPATLVIKTGSTVLLRLPITSSIPTSIPLPQPLQSADNEALTLEVDGQEGTGSTAVFVNAQGYTS